MASQSPCTIHAADLPSHSEPVFRVKKLIHGPGCEQDIDTVLVDILVVVSFKRNHRLGAHSAMSQCSSREACQAVPRMVQVRGKPVWGIADHLGEAFPCRPGRYGPAERNAGVLHQS